MHEHLLRFAESGLAEDETLIWWMRTGETASADWSAVERILAVAERARAHRFYFERDRSSYCAAHAMKRLLSASLLACDPQTIGCDYNPWGKPELIESNGLRINWSHTHGLAAVAVAWADDVGVDVECLDRQVSQCALAKRYFSSTEARVIANTPAASQTEVFLRHWTLKEAFVKAVGRGLSLPLDSFEINLTEDGRKAFLARCPADCGAVTQWQLWDRAIASHYRIAIARRSGHGGGAVRTREMTSRDLVTLQSRLPCRASVPG